MTFPDSLEARVQGGHLALAKQRLSNYIQKVKMKGYTSAPSALSPDNHRENFFFFLVFLGLHPQHMEIPRLGVKPELQLLAYATVIAMQDLSHIYDLYHSSWQCWILSPTERGQGSNPRPHGY